MRELTKLETLEKAVADTYVASDAANHAADHAADHAAYHAANHASAAFVAYIKARDELEDYLKEQQDND
tara:strand:- start:375 stop:581 length:207 start_codon:yes stop_codon:yes gene_type:complete